jgi:hypothetical protein
LYYYKVVPLLWSPVQAAHVMAGSAHGTTSEMPCAGAQADSASVQIHCQGNVHDSAPCSCTQACQANGMPASLAPARPPLVTPRRHIARAGERLAGFHASPWRPPSALLPI